ncbi:MAG: dihydropyrimidinase, partial [Dehalococcoidia bacterium]
GEIAQIGGEMGEATREIDARGLFVFPGGVDVHTHLSRTPGAERVDDFYSGSITAAAGGVTTVCDYAFQTRGTTLQETSEKARADGEANAIVDFGLHLVLGDPSPATRAEMPGLIDAGFTSFKIFMNQRRFNQRAEDYLRAMAVAGANGGIVNIHCEDETIISYLTERLLADGKTAPRYFPVSRPPISEAVAAARAVAMSEIAACPTYLVHLSSAAVLAVLRGARARGLPIFGEVRPIYLYLTDERYAGSRDESAKAVGNPPLRSTADQNALWEALRGGDIQTVATDHLPWDPEHKVDPALTFATIEPGMSNLETLLPMLYSEGVVKGRISVNRFVQLIATNPARLFGMYPRKGSIAVDSDADLVLFDPDKRVTVRQEAMHSRAFYDLFEGFEVQGWPRVTISRGEVIFQDGEVLGQRGRGQFLPRRRFSGP